MDFSIRLSEIKLDVGVADFDVDLGGGLVDIGALLIAGNTCDGDITVLLL